MVFANRKAFLSLLLIIACIIIVVGLVNQNVKTASMETFSIDYSIQSDWGSGSIVNVTIKNTGESAINGWTLAWAYSGSQKITNMWNGTYTQDEKSVVVKNAPYNAVISPGDTTSFGFILTYTGVNEKPANFSLNNSTTGSTPTSVTSSIIPSTTKSPVETTITTSNTTTANTTTAVTTPVDSLSKLLLVGRFDNTNSDSLKFAWTASTIKANFYGTNISAKIKSQGDNWFNVIIDNEVKDPINVSPNTTSPVILAKGLTAGNHSIELIKRTECNLGDVQFEGFIIDDGYLLDPPAPKSRRIEFIGDSITCGYGNEGTSQYQSFTTKNENGYLAYGSVTARLLEADQITVAWSGKGVSSNYAGNMDELFPELYDRILPYNTTLKWDAANWTPQVVVINLGTNDYSTSIPDKTVFTNKYNEFIKKIRTQYPGAHIYCVLGPLLYGDGLTEARTNIQSVVNSLTAAGDSKIHFIEFPQQDGSNGYGEDWHPSVATHKLMANQLVEQIKSDLNW